MILINAAGSARVENLSRSCRVARWSREKFDAVAEASQFPDHLARPHLLRLGTDGRSSLLVAHALVQDLPDQSTEPMGDSPDGLRMAKPRDEPTIDHGEDGPLGLDGGIGRLIEDASHLPVAFGAAVTVVHTGTLLVAGTRAHPGRQMLG